MLLIVVSSGSSVLTRGLALLGFAAASEAKGDVCAAETPPKRVLLPKRPPDNGAWVRPPSFMVGGVVVGVVDSLAANDCPGVITSISSVCPAPATAGG